MQRSRSGAAPGGPEGGDGSEKALRKTDGPPPPRSQINSRRPKEVRWWAGQGHTPEPGPVPSVQPLHHTMVLLFTPSTKALAFLKSPCTWYTGLSWQCPRHNLIICMAVFLLYSKAKVNNSNSHRDQSSNDYSDTVGSQSGKKKKTKKNILPAKQIQQIASPFLQPSFQLTYPPPIPSFLN